MAAAALDVDDTHTEHKLALCLEGSRESRTPRLLIGCQASKQDACNVRKAHLLVCRGSPLLFLTSVLYRSSASAHSLLAA